MSNQKGGVGKTTTAINLSTALAAVNNKELIMDLDAQGNASTGLGVPKDEREKSTYDLLTGKAGLKEVVKKTNNHLFLLLLHQLIYRLLMLIYLKSEGEFSSFVIC